MKTIKNEWKNIFNNKLLLASFLVVTIIPLLYAAFFLRSVWDPYNKTEDLPVAVVNKDKSVDYNGKTLNIGEDLIKQLKSNDDLGWNFVSENKAQEGLENSKYYMVVTIPEDFSTNAATVLDNNPKQMELQYETNGSLNYLGEVVSETAAKQLQQEVSKNVTASYTIAMFNQFKVAGEGLSQASAGSVQLSNGTNKLSSGSNQLEYNLNKLANSTLLFKTGVSQYNVGLKTYVNGVKQIDKGANSLSVGINELNKKIPTLTNGINSLYNGSKTLNESTNAYTNGVNTIKNGSDALVKNNDAIKSGMNDLTNGFGNISLLSNANNQVQVGLESISNNIVSDNQLIEDVNNINNTLQSLSSNQTTNNSEINNNIDNIQNNVNSIRNKQTNINIDSIVNNLASSSSMQSLDNETKQAILADLRTQLNNNQTADISSELSQIESSTTYLSNQASNLTSNNDSALQSSVDALAIQSNTTLVNASNSLTSTNEIKSELDTKIIPNIKQVNQGLNTLNQSNSKVNSLNQGINSYLDNSNNLNKGLTSLNANSNLLNSGSLQLFNGISTLNSNTSSLTKGVSQLSSGSDSLKNGSNKLAKNNNILLTSTATIDSSAQQLNDGSNKLASGSHKISAGFSELGKGINTLTSSLKSGADKINDVNMKDKNVNMFSNPNKLVHDKYSDVPNYGHALAPYVLSMSLYVACLIFNFIMPIRKVSLEEATTLSWWASKVSIALVAVLLMSTIEVFAMILLGLEPMYVGKMFAIAFVTGFAYIFLIMFLAMTFDNPGRFIAMIILILQLAGSGGTFPIQMSDAFFNMIHPFLPMTYSILGFREAITSGLGNDVFITSISIMLSIGVIFMLLTYISMRFLKRSNKQNKSQLDNNQSLLSTDYSYKS